MQPPRALRSHVALAPLCTFELGGAARFFVEARDEEAVIHAVAWARASGIATVVLGGGSNVVVSDAGFDGLVVRVATRGIDAAFEGDRVRVRVAAGEPWDALVDRAVTEGWAGVECLAGIPGSTGATPVQNVGAYGQDVAETIARVRVLDARTHQARVLEAGALGFAYRDSALKRREGDAADAVVLEVEFVLRVGGEPAVRYPELRRALGERARTLREVRDTVVALRRAKSMVLDPRDANRRSAGSFFTNPVVTNDVAARVVATALEHGLVRAADEVPRFDAGEGQTKLAAAWLIERSGFAKGERRGAVGISTKHALALVHHGGGTATALVDFAREIQQRVSTVFDVALAIEPVLVGRF